MNPSEETDSDFDKCSGTTNLEGGRSNSTETLPPPPPNLQNPELIAALAEALNLHQRGLYQLPGQNPLQSSSQPSQNFPPYPLQHPLQQPQPQVIPQLLNQPVFPNAPAPIPTSQPTMQTTFEIPENNQYQAPPFDQNFMANYHDFLRNQVNPNAVRSGSTQMQENPSFLQSSSGPDNLPPPTNIPGSPEDDFRKKVEILNLEESYGGEDARQSADNATLQQIFLAINAIISVFSMFRQGNYDPNSEAPRSIIVTFASEAEQQNVLSKAENLQRFKKWRDLLIRPYSPPTQYETTQSSQASTMTQERQRIAALERELFQLRQEQAFQNTQTQSFQKAPSPMPNIQAYKSPSPPPSYSSSPRPGFASGGAYQQPFSHQTASNQSQFPYQQNPQTQNQYFPQQQYSQVPLPQQTFPNQPNPEQMLQHLQHYISIYGSPYSNPQPPLMSMPHSPRAQSNLQQLPTLEQIYSFYNGSIPAEVLELYENVQSSTTSQSSLSQSSAKHKGTAKAKEESESESEYHSTEEVETMPQKEEYNNPLFGDQINGHRGPKQTLNILVLGETGVGKSTWINATANYMTFDTLNDASQARHPICLIPSRFTFYETAEKKHVVTMKPSQGDKENDENEDLSPDGQSATQEPRTYQFETAKYVINIIDSPGIGDTRGPDQDRENTKKILNTLKHYKELHAICFLFKSNEARLTLSFQYCISELLIQLHKDAVNNIVFFFTNARASGYRPGNTRQALEEFLKEIKRKYGLEIPFTPENRFCTDNEGFQLVAVHANGISFEEEDFKKKFSGSWKKAAAETHRFLDYAAARRAHCVSDTVSINEARAMIYNLAKPLADVNEWIESNIKVLNDRKKDLRNTTNDIDALRKKLKFKHIGIEVRPLDYPKTVCTSANCTTTQILAGTEQFQTIYEKVCHNRCYLSGVDVEKPADPHLISCAAMRGENCHQCGCHWTSHMHIRFDQIKTTMEVEDNNTKELIKQNKDAATVKENAIQECDNRVNEYKAEQQQIIDISLDFGKFLYANAIMSYNDAFENYVKKSIKEEEKCVQAGGSRTKLDNLKKNLALYQEEKRMALKAVEDAKKNPDGNNCERIRPDNIEVAKDQLFALQHCGKTIKNLFEATKDGIEKNNAHVIIKYTPDVQRPRQMQTRNNSSRSEVSRNPSNNSRQHKSRRNNR